MEIFNRKMMVGWITGLFLFLWMGYFFGYFVATDKAVEGLKEREAKWEQQSKAFRERQTQDATELAKLNSTLTDQGEELKVLRLKYENLQRDLQRVKTAAQKNGNEQEGKIASLEAFAAMKMAELKEAHRVIAQKNLISTDRFDLHSPLTLKQIVTAKNAFHDIQHEVAAGNFKGLDLTNGYQRLKAIFESPDLEQLEGAYDTAKGEGR
ncbi:MAG TPA: hypothetical protein VLE43_09215 [Candidatus Saccharimonadia bacterium]|nr:hypothetical protein [Candidatus Saccharimonadia bacterium]